LSLQIKKMLSQKKLFSLLYHDIFDYPLTSEELNKWLAGNIISKKGVNIDFSDGYYFLKGRKKLVKKRLKRARYSKKKFSIAQKKALLIAKIPTVKFIGITGSLAMNNCKIDSDIDFILVTKSHTLWITRLFVYLLLLITRTKVRHPKDSIENNKLCLNIWMDELNLKINKKNIYTAHELAQIKPLVDKGNIFSELIYANSWILNYWPNAVNLSKTFSGKSELNKKNTCFLIKFLNKLFFKAQLFYMKPKHTNEKTTLFQAFFHPNDLSIKVLKRLG